MTLHTPRIVIGLTGLAGSGKSTIAKRLTCEHRFSRKPFAYPLKAMLSAVGVPTDILDGDNAAKEAPLDVLGGKSCRHAMQTLGTEWGRMQMDGDFWVRLWERGTANLTRIVADDVRFPNEVEAIRRLGGVILRVERRGSGTAVNPAHVSEAISALPYDMLVRNDGGIADLEALIDTVVRSKVAA